MYQISRNTTDGTITLSDSWSISATGSSAAPQLLQPDDEFVFSYIELEGVEKFKTFTYDYLGRTENRFVETFYRISRDGQSYTNWLTLAPSIGNFPPINPSNQLWIDIKFVRKGTSTVGSIKILEYSINGTLERNIVQGDQPITLTPDESTFILKPPFIYKVFKITDIEIISSGEIDVDYTIKYRFSQDYGRTVSQWEYFTKENITSLRITPIRFFQIEYLIELSSSSAKIYDINLIGDFQNVSKDYFKTNLFGVRENCNCLKLGIVGDPSSFPSQVSGDEDSSNSENISVLPQLTEEDKTKLFEPYKLEVANNLLNKMSNDANLIFGHEVTYFLTDPDRKGIDYTFHDLVMFSNPLLL